MREITLYLVQVIAASGIFYAYYHFVLRNKKFHRYNRFYLLAASIISLVIPFLNIPLYFTETQQQSSALLQTLTVVSGSEYEQEVIVQAGTRTKQGLFTLKNILYVLYILTAAVALTRVFLSLKKIRKIAKNNPSEKIENIHFVNTDEPGTPFSFFRWLFWNRKIELNSAKGKQVFRHELFHIEQKHSFDIIFLELLTVVFWINPFFHLIKKEVKAIHEFLADQFAIHEENKWEYAELLLQQALDTKLSLVNPFFHNQIKRRIAMITNSKKPGYQYIRKLMALPVAAIAVGLFAFTYKSVKTNGNYYNGKQVTVVIDAGHGGNDAGAKAADGTTEKDLTLAIAKKVKELNTNENIRIVMTRETDIFPPLQNRVDYTKENNADVFLSLHINNSPDKTQKGSEAIVSAKNDLFEKHNSSLATSILNSIADVWNVKMEIKKRQMGIWVLDNAPCPSVLIECGNISNQEDLSFIKQEQNQKKIAQAILDGIIKYIVFSTESSLNEITINFDKTDTLPRKITPDNGNKVFEKVEVEAAFPGGNEKWRQYLERSLNATVPINNKAPNGTYTTITQFIVGLDGSITDIKPLTKHGYGMEEEAIRVISKGPKWLPAIVNGNPVKSYRKQPLTFLVLQENVFDGNKTDNSVAITKDMLNEVVVVGYQQETDNRLFGKIEEPAQFPGGSDTRKNILTKNLNANVPFDAQTKIAIAPTKLNVFYMGVDNPVSIAASGAAEDKITVTIDGGGGSITKTGTGLYNVRVAQVSNDCVLSVFVDGKLAGASNFRVRSLPVPFAIIGSYQSGTKVAASDFKKQAGVGIYLKDFPFEVHYEVVGFTFTIDTDNGEIRTAECQGAAFSPVVKTIINQHLKPGRMVTIDNILVKGPAGKEKKIPSLVYYIK